MMVGNEQFVKDVYFGMPAAHNTALDCHGAMGEAQLVVFTEFAKTFRDIY